jgi:sec-independent protein translocase protein TatA
MEFFTPGHLVVLAIVALVLFFGWKQLPEMSRSLGRSLRIFKTEIKGMSEDDKARKNAQAQPPALEGAPAADASAQRPVQPMAPPTAVPPVPPVTQPVAESAEPAARPRPRPSPVASPPAGQSSVNGSVNGASPGSPSGGQ